jgi:hypothetical protein
MALRSVRNVEDAFLEAVDEMPEGYLECRGSQHRFNIIEPFRIVDSAHEAGARPHMGHVVYAKRTLKCDRCIDPETGKSMIRHDFYAITSRRGHTYLEKINATYEGPPRYATKGLGRVDGNRGLILGAQLDLAMNQAPVRGRGRPKKGTA